MPTYVYETIPDFPEEKPERFEIRQRMTEEPLTHHPETGARVRRVISGGIGPMTSKAPSSQSGGGG